MSELASGDPDRRAAVDIDVDDRQKQPHVPEWRLSNRVPSIRLRNSRLQVLGVNALRIGLEPEGMGSGLRGQYGDPWTRKLRMEFRPGNHGAFWVQGLDHLGHEVEAPPFFPRSR